MATIASLKYLPASRLSSLLLAQDPASPSKIAIIDVRDDDHVGGHIKGSTHVPSRVLDHKIPELVRKLKDTDTVVFHCALSQQRGPTAALRYLRERERLLGVKPAATTGKIMKKSAEAKVGEGEEDWEDVKREEEKIEQKVFVLDKGFVGWQEAYGEDQRLTEDYVKEIWLEY